jgi:hypothetical protein
MKQVLFIEGFQVKYKGTDHEVVRLNADRTTCVLKRLSDNEPISAVALDVIDENEDKEPVKKVKKYSENPE